MRFHMLHNIDTVLHFLHCKKIKLVNIRSEDIVDGNPKLTLGLIWTIILHYQVSVSLSIFQIFVFGAITCSIFSTLPLSVASCVFLLICCYVSFYRSLCNKCRFLLLTIRGQFNKRSLKILTYPFTYLHCAIFNASLFHVNADTSNYRENR